jgi:hypothetical protein
MSKRKQRFYYSVVRDGGGPGYADVALVRSAVPQGVLSHILDRGVRDVVVIHHRSFRPLFDLSAMEAYAGQLERVAAHGNEGTLGCFVDIEDQTNGTVRIALYERWFDGDHVRCEELAAREFEATEEGAVTDSAEFLAELRAWAEKRNDEREAQDPDDEAAETVQSERTMDRADAARQLARILRTIT